MSAAEGMFTNNLSALILVARKQNSCFCSSSYPLRTVGSLLCGSVLLLQVLYWFCAGLTGSVLVQVVALMCFMSVTSQVKRSTFRVRRHIHGRVSSQMRALYFLPIVEVLFVFYKFPSVPSITGAPLVSCSGLVIW